MLILRGAPALSPFRVQKLLDNLRTQVPAITAVYAEFVHFADVDGELDASGRALLEQLLRYGPALAAGRAEGQLLLVVPRPGTISPWASKATVKGWDMVWPKPMFSRVSP